MVTGITGVLWLPRTATVNSTMLNAGAHAVPVSAASAAWTDLAATYAEASATLARVLGEIGGGLAGANGTGALARLGEFAGWTERMAAVSTAAAGKAAAAATAYTVATLAMPSLPEIAAAQAATVAAYTTGGVLNGAAEAAETYERSLDLRAAAAMAAYEAATTAMVGVPSDASPPAPIANGAAAPDPPAGGADPAGQPTVERFVADPVGTAGAAMAALAQHPAVQAGLAQAGQIAGQFAAPVASSVAGAIGDVSAAAVGAVGRAIGEAGTAATSAAGPALGGAATLGTPPTPGPPTTGHTPIAGPPPSTRGGAGRTHAASFGPNSAAGALAGTGLGAAGWRLPAGWGGTAGLAAGAVDAATPTAPASLTPDPVAPAPSGANGPMLGHAHPATGRDGDATEDHRNTTSPAMFDHFADGRAVAPAVLGAGPER